MLYYIVFPRRQIDMSEEEKHRYKNEWWLNSIYVLGYCAGKLTVPLSLLTGTLWTAISNVISKTCAFHTMQCSNICCYESKRSLKHAACLCHYLSVRREFYASLICPCWGKIFNSFRNTELKNHIFIYAAARQPQLDFEWLSKTTYRQSRL